MRARIIGNEVVTERRCRRDGALSHKGNTVHMRRADLDARIKSDIFPLLLSHFPISTDILPDGCRANGWCNSLQVDDS